MTADNKRTVQMCQFIATNGLPESSEANTFEELVLDWANEIASRLKTMPSSVDESDLNIIREHGLYDTLFPNQTQLQTDENLNPFDIGVWRPELQKWMCRWGNATIVANIETLRRTYNVPHLSATAADTLPYWLQYLKHYKANNPKKGKRKNRNPQNGTAAVRQPQSFVPPATQFTTQQPIFRPTQPVPAPLPVPAPARPDKVFVTRTHRKERRNNPEIIWARPYSGNFVSHVSESDLIGHAQLQQKNGNLAIYGIENMAIYPSGAVKLYMRTKNRNGTYGFLLIRWLTSSNILTIQLKHGFNFNIAKQGRFAL